MRDLYLGIVGLIERLHRQFLEVVKTELDRLRVEDINNIQSLILFNIGQREMTVGELTARGYYLGSNVSYNVGKMVQNGYLEQQRSSTDRRAVKIKLSQKGLDLYATMDKLFDAQVESLLKNGELTEDQLKFATDHLLELEKFWVGLLGYGGRYLR